MKKVEGTSGMTTTDAVDECILPCFSVSGTLYTLQKLTESKLLMNSTLVLQMLIDFFSSDLEHTKLAPFVYSEISMIFLLLAPPALPLSVCLVHGD